MAEHRGAGRAIAAVTGPVRRTAQALALALLATGCSLWPPQALDDTVLHLLDARPEVGVAARPDDRVLSVSVPRAGPGLDSAAIAYVRAPHVLEHYASHRWADRPARLLAPLLVRTLDDSGGFRAVVKAPSGARVDLQLDTELLRLQQDFRVRPSRVELSLRVQLTDLPGRRVVATRTIEVVEDAPTDDVRGGVVAANRAVARALAQVAAFCIEASAGPRQAGPRIPR